MTARVAPLRRPAAARSTTAAPRRDALVIAGLAVLAHALLLTSAALELRLLCALVAFVLLPGYLIVQAVFTGSRPGPLERGLLALGVGYIWAMLVMLLLHGLVRPLDPVRLLAGAALLNTLPLLAALVRGANLRLRPRPASFDRAALAVLAATIPLRVWNLGHSEFQGDEGKVVLRAAAVLQGMPDALIAHRKPPGEVLLEALFGGALGTVTEATARLPFTLAGVAGVVACYCLGRALFGWRAGLIAGLLLAVNGYFVAFARIVQYPSLVLLLDALAILCLYRFARAPAARRGHAVLGALLLGGAGLTALSAVFLLPVAALALWRHLFRPGSRPRPELAIWLWPLALLGPVLLLAYGLVGRDAGGSLEPDIVARYWGIRLGSNRPYFNLSDFLVTGSYYNSSPYDLVVLGGGLLVVLAPLGEQLRGLAARRRSRRTGELSAAWLTQAEGPPIAVQWLRWLPALAVIAIVATLLRSARRPLAWKLPFIWLAVPLFAHLFLVRDVATHWREILPGLVLLLGAALAHLHTRWANGRARWLLPLAGLVLLAPTAQYIYVTRLQPEPEYDALYPQSRHSLDWSGLLTRDRASGTFGSAHLYGWKTVGVLIARGELPASYATNEYPDRIAWYLKAMPTCSDDAQLYIRAPLTPADERAIEGEFERRDYERAGRVYVDRQARLALFVRPELNPKPEAYHSDRYVRRFDRDLASPWAPVGTLYQPTRLECGP